MEDHCPSGNGIAQGALPEIAINARRGIQRSGT
jgi:hypothetical protein